MSHIHFSGTTEICSAVISYELFISCKQVQKLQTAALKLRLHNKSIDLIQTWVPLTYYFWAHSKIKPSYTQKETYIETDKPIDYSTKT